MKGNKYNSYFTTLPIPEGIEKNNSPTLFCLEKYSAQR